MDRHRTSQTPDRDEQIHELGFRAQQLRELVEDQEQRGHGWEVVFSRDPVRLVVGDVGVVARIAQHLLPAHHLTAQGVLHAVHQGQLRLQVRDHGRHVGQIRHAREGRTALEVDQDEVQLLRRMRQRHRQHQRSQHLGLAGTGRTDQQAVRSHALLSRFLDVEGHRDALRGHPEGHLQPIATLTPLPLPVRVEVADVAAPQQLRQVLGTFRIGLADRGLRLGSFLVGPRGHAPRDRLGLGLPHDVRGGDDGFLVEEQQLHLPAVPVLLPGVQDHAQGRSGGHRPPGRHGPHDRHALGPPEATEGAVDRQVHTVEDQEEMRPRRRLRTCPERTAIRVLLAEHLLQLAGTGDHHAGRPQGIADLRGTGVGQPLDPLPVFPVRLGTHDRDAQGLWGGEGRHVHEHGPHLRARHIDGTGDVDVAEVAEHDTEGHLVNHRVRVDEPPHRGVAHHVGLGEGGDLRFDELHRQRLRGGSQSHLHGHHVAHLPFPQAGALLGDQHQRIR